MKILTSPQSGSYQGLTASRNRFGQYFRTRAIPVQPRTPKQTQTRAYLTTGSSSWRLLTVPQQTAWNDYAAQILRSDHLGSSYSPTGAALFAGSIIALQSTASTVTDPPTVLPTYGLVVTGMTYTDPTPGPEAFTFATPSNANNLVLVETSGPLSPGVTSAGAVRRWRSLPGSALNLNPTLFTFSSTPVPFLTEYKYLFPSPVTGQAIWFRFRELFVDPANPTVAIANSMRQTFRFVVP